MQLQKKVLIILYHHLYSIIYCRLLRKSLFILFFLNLSLLSVISLVGFTLPFILFLCYSHSALSAWAFRSSADPPWPQTSSFLSNLTYFLNLKRFCDFSLTVIRVGTKKKNLSSVSLSTRPVNRIEVIATPTRQESIRRSHSCSSYLTLYFPSKSIINVGAETAYVSPFVLLLLGSGREDYRIIRTAFVFGFPLAVIICRTCANYRKALQV